MKFVTWADRGWVRTTVDTGATNTSHQSEVIALHAVAKDEDGSVSSTTECGRQCSFEPDETGFRPWQETKVGTRCPTCTQNVGAANAADHH